MKGRLTKGLLAGLLGATMLLSACGSGAGESTSKADLKGGDDGSIRAELDAVSLTSLMGNGINLGNTMEAYGHTSLGVSAEVSAYETLWGQPVTTPEMIESMKAVGFDSIRIPVAWTNMMDFESGDYTIDSAYLDRVEEIVGYARSAGMYVIINDHWDGSWWGMYGSASEDTRTAARELYKSMWTQIAERFKNYSDYVIFESANEELGYRLNDTEVAADSGTLSDDECYEVTNEINQSFVDTVRATGGNNENRFLLIAGFDTDINSTVDARYEMPTDTAKDKLLISVHYYDPSGYCVMDSVASWGSKTEYETMNDTLAKMTKFTDEGVGVIIGEYGIVTDGGVIKEGSLNYFQNFLNNCDTYGYCPMLWDTNNLFIKTEGKFIDASIARLYEKHSLSIQETMSAEDILAQAAKEMTADLENAPEAAAAADDEAIAWIMYTSGDWSVQYNVGDVYSPDSATAGVVANDVEITGPGTYTVSLDLTGTDAGFGTGVTFSALAIANGEILFPGYYITIDELLINGQPYEYSGQPYTTSDDSICTRVNLYNGWVSQVPDEARVKDDNGKELSPVIIDAETIGNVETIEITFTYGE